MTSQNTNSERPTESSEWAPLVGFGICTTYLIFLVATHLREGGAAMTLEHESTLVDLVLMPTRTFGLLGAYVLTISLGGMFLLLWMRQRLSEVPRRAIGLPLFLLALSSLAALIEGGSSVWGGLFGELLAEGYETILPRPLAFLVAGSLVGFGLVMARDWFFFNELRAILTNQPASPAFALGLGGGEVPEMEDAEVRSIPRKNPEHRPEEPSFELGGPISMSSATAELAAPGAGIVTLGGSQTIPDDLEPMPESLEVPIPEPAATENELDSPITDQIPIQVISLEADESAIVSPEEEVARPEEAPRTEELAVAESDVDTELEAFLIDEESEEAFDEMPQLDWSSTVTEHSDADLFGGMTDDDEPPIETSLSSAATIAETEPAAIIIDENLEFRASDLLDEERTDGGFETTADLDEDVEFEADAIEDEDDVELEADEYEDEDDVELEADEYEDEDDVELEADEYEDEDDVELEADEYEDEDDVELEADEYEDEDDVELEADEYEDEDDVELEADEYEDEDDVELEADEYEDEDDVELEADEYEDEDDVELEAIEAATDSAPLTQPESSAGEKPPVDRPSEFGPDTKNLLDTDIDDLFEEDEDPIYEISDYANRLIDDEEVIEDAGVSRIDYEAAPPTSFHTKEAESLEGDLVDDPEEIEFQQLLFGDEPVRQEGSWDKDTSEETDNTTGDDEVQSLIPVEDEEPSELDRYSESASRLDVDHSSSTQATPTTAYGDDDWAPWGEDSAPVRPALQEEQEEFAVEPPHREPPTRAAEPSALAPEIDSATAEEIDWVDQEDEDSDKDLELEAEDIESVQLEEEELEYLPEEPEASGVVDADDAAEDDFDLLDDFSDPNEPMEQETEAPIDSAPRLEEAAPSATRDPEVTDGPKVAAVSVQAGAPNSPFSDLGEDFYAEAVALCLQQDSCRISFLQRNLSIDFAQAAAVIERMESEGLVGPYSGSGSHEILVNYDDWRTGRM